MHDAYAMVISLLFVEIENMLSPTRVVLGHHFQTVDSYKPVIHSILFYFDVSTDSFAIQMCFSQVFCKYHYAIEIGWLQN
jgi:hypothetical protein